MSAMRGALAANVAVASGLITVVVVLLISLASRRGPTRRPSGLTDRRLSVRRALRTAAIGTTIAVGASSVIVAGPGPALVGGVLAGVAIGRRRRRAALRQRRDIEAALPDAIELLVLCVHAGRSPTQAVVELARRTPRPVRDGFVTVERQLHRGRGLADALDELPRLLGPAARGLASSIAMADREGLPLAPVLDRLALEARAERRRLGEAAARRLPVRLSFPLVVCTLPSFVLLAIAPAVLGALSTLRGTVP